jgi:hypothetical protein
MAAEDGRRSGNGQAQRTRGSAMLQADAIQEDLIRDTDSQFRFRTSDEPLDGFRASHARPGGLKPLPPKSLMRLPDPPRAEGPAFKLRAFQRNAVAPAMGQLPGQVLSAQADLSPELKEMLENQERMLKILKETMQGQTVRFLFVF